MNELTQIIPSLKISDQALNDMFDYPFEDNLIQ